MFGKSVRVEGSITGSEDIVFEGELKGTVQLASGSFTLGASGHADAAIEAKHVIIAGALTGEIVGAQSVALRSTARMSGKITCGRLSIEYGAIVNARIDTLTERIQSNQEPTKEQVNNAPLAAQLSINLS